MLFFTFNSLNIIPKFLEPSRISHKFMELFDFYSCCYPTNLRPREKGEMTVRTQLQEFRWMCACAVLSPKKRVNPTPAVIHLHVIACPLLTCLLFLASSLLTHMAELQRRSSFKSTDCSISPTLRKFSRMPMECTFIAKEIVILGSLNCTCFCTSRPQAKYLVILASQEDLYLESNHGWPVTLITYLI
jgi:hypothetical protein